MSQWELAVGASLVTAAILNFVRWRFRGRGAVGSVTLLLVVLLAAVTAAPATAQVANSDYWTGSGKHVATTSHGDCEWVRQTMATGDPQYPGEPYVATEVTVDGGPNCSWTSFQAAPKALSFRQDLYNWDPSQGIEVPCNFGPRLVNNNWTHVAYTSWGPQAYSAPPVCGTTWYQLKSYNYYNVYGTTVWNGGILWAMSETPNPGIGWFYVCANPGYNGC